MEHEHDPFIVYSPDGVNSRPTNFALVDADTVFVQDPNHGALLGGTDQFTGQNILFLLDPPAVEQLRDSSPPAMYLVPEYAIQHVGAI